MPTVKCPRTVKCPPSTVDVSLTHVRYHALTLVVLVAPRMHIVSGMTNMGGETMKTQTTITVCVGCGHEVELSRLCEIDHGVVVHGGHVDPRRDVTCGVWAFRRVAA